MSVGTVVSETSQRAGRPTVSERARAVLWDPALPAVVALTVLGAALRFYRIGHQGYWFDEGNTALLVHFSLGKMLGLIPQTESTPPLYYCLAWAWARVFGYGESALRSLSALAGVLTIPVAFQAARQLVSTRVGLAVAALSACNPFLIWYSQEARSYSLLVMLSAASLLGFAYVLERPTPRRVAAWVVFSGLALATHYYGVVVVAPEAAWLLYRLRTDQSVRIGLAIVALCGLALIPLALSQSSTGHDSWIAGSDLGVRLRQIVPQFLIGTDAPARKLLKFLALAGALLGLGCLAWRRREPEARGALLGAGLALSGFVLSLAFIAAGSDALITRNIIGLWLPAAIAVATGLTLARPAALGALVTGALCAIGVTATVAIATDWKLQRPDWRLLARVLGARPALGASAATERGGTAAGAPRPEGVVGGRLILIQHYRTLLPLSLYLPHLHFLSGRGAAGVRELDVVAFSSPQQPLCWWGAACNLIPSRMQAAYSVPGFHRLWLRRVRQFTVLRLVADHPQHVTPREVSRALYTTTLPRDELLYQR